MITKCGLNFCKIIRIENGNWNVSKRPQPDRREKTSLRWYLTLQGDNSVKSAKRFNYVVLLREYWYQWSKLVFAKLLYNQCNFSDKMVCSNF